MLGPHLRTKDAPHPRWLQVLATASIAIAALTLAPAQAHAAVNTLENQPVGAAPSGTRTYGTATVQQVKVAGVTTRAVRVLDSSTSAPSRVLFLHGAKPGKRFAFDFLPRATTQPTVLAVHGTGASENTGTWRFSIKRASSGSTTGVVSVYNGSAWSTLATVAGLHNPGAWNRLVIDASTTWAGITVGGKQYRTTTKAAAATAITSLEVASSGTKPTGTDTYIDNLEMSTTGVVVTTEPSGYEARFPDMIKLADGRLMAVYHSATAHSRANGSIKATYSSNRGQSWTKPVTVVGNAYDNRDPKLTQLKDGTVLLTFFQTQWSGSTGTNRGVWTARMEAGGSSFAAPIRVTTSGAEHAPAVEVGPGHVIQPMYGGGARVAHSHDGGRTWKATDQVYAARNTAAYEWQEPNVTKLPGGGLVMLIRSYDRGQARYVGSFLTRSDDGGLTWSELRQTDLVASSHHQLLTSSGALLLTYGDPGAPGRPTRGALIADPAGSWSGAVKTLIYDSGQSDQANPTSVEISPGRYLSLGYNVATRQLITFETTDATYR